ncbi:MULTISPECIES: WD40 repeat domain-containing protein [Pseudanabaena]|uniref:WD-40 repeat-containing protein n=2 Tax=Pseudanabaena TaxID=1152 RepID=L8MZP2_9CYAN|nr:MULTISPECIES: WD40 repeat domain-containing protein [Pseudanabaena]ELS32234.1 WD-40 repeat-containing protein [Pseudanabaena biceps PCC 7429]MDG3495515.1 WD40 repeat domain-containing protein [Pseudanabaena catenata USMAC16]
MSDRTDIIADNNRDALRRLTRIVTRSQGFSLSITLCNYRILQNRVLQDLRSQLAANNLPETAIAIIELKPDTKTLLAPIQVLMGEVNQLPPEQKPKVLMVLGLDAVTEIEVVLKSANRVREEFANCLEFPMVLWLNDRTQDILTREASDLANWTTAGAIEFQLDTDELKILLQESTEEMFELFLNLSNRKSLQTAIASGLQRFELRTAVTELETKSVIDLELRANLDFAFGCIAFTESQINQAKELFQKSLAFWQGGNQLKQAVCLLQLGMCDRAIAFRSRFNKEPFYRTSQQYFTQSIAIFRQIEQWDLVAEYINFLTVTVEELASLEFSTLSHQEQLNNNLWEELESLANEALVLHQTYPNPLREANDRGILAAVRLVKADYAAAKQFAESALALYQDATDRKLPNLPFSERYIYGKYELWLAKALAGMDDKQGAIARLEGVRDRWRHQYDARVYVAVLEELRSLYTSAGLYLEAFETKQHQRSVEQQYGLRAFIGAGTLNPKREASNPDMYASISFKNDGIAQEIEASGRMQDVQNLVDRIGQARFPLTVVHGDSGAGKSSILSGGVIPALRARESFDGRKVLVLVVRNYKDWSLEIKRQLDRYFSDRSPDLDPIHHFKRNIEENYLTVIIFDQFEDFFFKKEDFRDRLPFYKFLKACLHTDFVRVVLSLREDYLHYLLECDRAVDLEKVENDILGKQVRYYVGDFTQDQARQVIEALTRRSQLRLEPELIDRLVTDLSGEQLRILPIELQVVGAQLESENPPITNLREYMALTCSVVGAKHQPHYTMSGRKPSEVLVERWLENVVRDCGVANKDLAERVLYALTGNEEKRPQKTQAELASELLGVGSSDGFRSPPAPLKKGGEELRQFPLFKGDAEGRGIELLNEAENLSLVLAVLVGSGLAFRVSSSPDDRFQLIHDYLVSFIRKKYVFGMAEELRMTKEQLRLALAEKENALAEKDKELQRAEIAEIEALSIACEAYWLANKELEAMITGLKAARCIFDPDIRKIVPSYIKDRTLGRLWEVIYNIREANRLEGHNKSVTSVAFSPDGKTIASGSNDKTIKLWNLEGKELRTLIGHRNGVWSVAFSPDGKIIASGSSDYTIKLWNLEGKELQTLTGHSNWVESVAFSPDGKIIASGSSDLTIKLWNLEGKELRTLTGHSNIVMKVAFSPDGKTIVSGSDDKTIKLWDLAGKELRTLTGHSNEVWSVAFSPDGKTIASGSNDKTIKLWDLAGKELRTLTGHSNGVWSVAFSPDGKIIASGSRDHTIKLWDLKGKEIQTLTGHSNIITRVAFSPDGKTIASGSADHTIKLWNLKEKEPQTLTGHSKIVMKVAFSPDGKTIASGSYDSTIKLWNLAGEKLRTLRVDNNFGTVAFSPDGKTIASDGYKHTIKLWNLAGKKLRTLTGHSNAVGSVAFSPDGKTIVSGSYDHTIKLWDLEGKELRTLTEHSSMVMSVAFSPDGKTIVSGSDDNTIKLWNLEGKVLRTLTGHRNWVGSVAFSPDGKTIVSGSSDNTIKLWNLEGKVLRTLTGHSNWVNSVAFSPDGKTIASGSSDNTIKLWDIDPELAISEACDWLRPYLTNNPNVSESDRQLLGSKK